MSVPGLEKSLHQYTLEPSEKPFDMKTVPLATAPITEQKTGALLFLCFTFKLLLSTGKRNMPLQLQLYYLFVIKCQKSHQWLQVKLLRNWDLHARTFTKVSRHVILSGPISYPGLSIVPHQPPRNMNRLYILNCTY